MQSVLFPLIEVHRGLLNYLGSRESNNIVNLMIDGLVDLISYGEQ
jgi:hypothetical protein